MGDRGGSSTWKGKAGETTTFVWDVGDDAVEEKEPQFMLLGKIWSSKSINAKAAMGSMIKLWSMKGLVVGKLIDAKEKIFMFRFQEERDKTKIFDWQPWHFDKFICCFSEPNLDGRMTDVPLHFVPIWARVYDLPLRGRTNKENVKRLGSQLGSFITVDDASFLEMERAIRLRIMHDVREPLKAVVVVGLPLGRTEVFRVTYERLPTYCYGCGVLGHGEKDCDEGPYDEGELRSI